MNYEKYKNALEKAKVRYNEIKDTNCSEEKFLLELFPELKESEDERIRRNIIAALRGEGYYDCDLTNECIAWLEKQGDQNPTWSDEDEEMIDKIIDYMKPMPIFFESTKGKSGKEYTKEFIKNAIKWLKSIKGRIQPQQKWTEEDENGFGETLWAINKARTIAENENDMGNLWYAENWLKSLKERLS